jgi:LPS export ABC transporter protein LptC
VTCLFFFLLSCVNDLDSIKKISYKLTDPDERTSELNVIYSDSGFAKIELYAKLAETYSKPEKIVKFKDGLKVNFFDDEGNVSSILTALYGEIKEQNGTIFVRDSVRLMNNKKNQLLETEELHWNRKDSTIYTDKAVIVRTSEALFLEKESEQNKIFQHTSS